eukprot:scaffold301674_cov32-Tisochrysis_lutea.AAC.1
MSGRRPRSSTDALRTDSQSARSVAGMHSFHAVARRGRGGSRASRQDLAIPARWLGRRAARPALRAVRGRRTASRPPRPRVPPSHPRTQLANQRPPFTGTGRK